MQKSCTMMLTDDIVKNILNDEGLIVKYYKFKNAKMVMNNKRLKFCPIVNCDSYVKKNKNKFVECQNGHKLCFDCLIHGMRNKTARRSLIKNSINGEKLN
jgi:hypothetical protein